MKSVPNLISYLHDFFQNFSQSLAICFELFSFGVVFNPSLAPPVSRQPTSPVAAPSRPSHGPKPCRPDRLAPIIVTPRCRLRTGEPPFPAVSLAPAPCRRWLAVQRRRRTLAPCATHAGRACATLCIWAERGFGPETLKLNFVIF
jgi:hypothetical protein